MPEQVSNLYSSEPKSDVLPVTPSGNLLLWNRAGSNRRHADFQSAALPAELRLQIWFFQNQKTVQLTFTTSLGFRCRRGGQIRTDDLLLPKQARYRATLHPEKF